MKLVKYGFVLLALILVTDTLLARWQLNSFCRQVGSEDFLAVLGSRIKPGMTRLEVDRVVEGYRTLEVENRESEEIIGYGYWFGFIPPFRKTGVKFAGETRSR